MIAIIPARGGSKGIPNKNIIDLAGKPLIAYTIESVQCSNISGFIISTDSQEIADVAKSYGAYIDKLRPAELATDEATTADVVKYEKQRLDIGGAVMILQPTAPLRTSEDINNAIDCYRDGETLASVYSLEDYPHPRYMHYADGSPVIEGKIRRRQEHEEIFIRNGAIYITDDGHLTDKPILYVMPRNRSINIDTYEDLKICEYLIKNR